VSAWNRLLSHVAEPTTINSFKNRFDSIKEGTP